MLARILFSGTNPQSPAYPQNQTTPGFSATGSYPFKRGSGRSSSNRYVFRPHFPQTGLLESQRVFTSPVRGLIRGLETCETSTEGFVHIDLMGYSLNFFL